MNLITPNTPVKFRDDICEALNKAHAATIEEHGATYTVNLILADYLRRRGHSIAQVETPAQKITAAQERRWGAIREANEVDTEKEKRRRELKRERDKRYKANKKKKKAEAAGKSE